MPKPPKPPKPPNEPKPIAVEAFPAPLDRPARLPSVGRSVGTFYERTHLSRVGCNPAAVTSRVPAELAERFDLANRVRVWRGRYYIGGRFLDPADLDTLLDAIDDPEVGVHLDELQAYPGLGAWLRWERLGQLRHLSFSGTWMKQKGLKLVLSTANLGELRSLQVGECDIGHGGLKLLRDTAVMPKLEALDLQGDYEADRTKWDHDAVEALLTPAKGRTLGASLLGLQALSLDAWVLHKAETIETLASSELIHDLGELNLSNAAPEVANQLVTALSERGGKLHTLVLVTSPNWGNKAPKNPLPLRSLVCGELAGMDRAWFWDSLEEITVKPFDPMKSEFPLPPSLKHLRIEFGKPIPDGFLTRISENPVVQALESLTLATRGGPKPTPSPDEPAWAPVVQRAVDQL